MAMALSFFTVDISSSSSRLQSANAFGPARGRPVNSIRCSLDGNLERGRSRQQQESEKNQSSLVVSRRDSLKGLATFSLFFLSSPPAFFPALSHAETATACNELLYSASGLGFCDSLPGNGIEAVKGMLIKAHYTGRLENGKVFDSSYNRGKPLTFRVGVGEVIKGWDEGIAGGQGIPAMLAGGKRTLKIPAELAYGERGAGCRGGSCLIPPGSVLLFDVEFVGKV